MIRRSDEHILILIDGTNKRRQEVMYFVKRMQAILAAILVLVLAAPAWAGTGYAHPELLIETDELAKIMSQSNVRVV
ncbi:MAG: hypothetical protein HZA69_03415, partial [Gammaproteobacteria bacterium]|nr:hypothetical protein [Gammaproteobacteria bacterium]